VQHPRAATVRVFTATVFATTGLQAIAWSVVSLAELQATCEVSFPSAP
jgi:hypothetical protein